VKRSIPQRLSERKRRIRRRLDQANGPAKYERAVVNAPPVLQGQGLRFELSDKNHGVVEGGAALFLRLAKDVGLVNSIDRRLKLLKIHLPYHESDHVLNIALNALCDGNCLQDIELRRNSEAFLDMLGTDSIPDPTTAGDFCRRFSPEALTDLEQAIDDARLNVWSRQSSGFFEEATIEADGVIVETGGECKRGMDISYNGKWGYHALLMTMANTCEVLRLVNRPANRPSHEGAGEKFDECIALAKKAGFRRIRLRGDTDFSQTTRLDGWHEQNVLFSFGIDASAALKIRAELLDECEWKELERPGRPKPKTRPRKRPPNIKRQIIRTRDFKHLELESEQVAEFSYRPVACRRDYRIVVIRKNISVEMGDTVLFPEYRYFFYITNDETATAAEIVFGCNDRCNQENIFAQLGGGIGALRAPLDDLVSNNAYMLMASLAWTLKAWGALLVPVNNACRAQHEQERTSLLRMEFKTFVNAVIRIPCQIVRQARRRIVRVLAWNPYLPAFFRLAQVLRC
jgi:hypothetical protein